MDSTFAKSCYATMLSKLPGQLHGDYQNKGVMWMLEREDAKNAVRGGFVCDDMGMGKTNQCVATMVANDLKKPTLIITLVATVSHWKETLKTFGGITPIVLKPNFKGAIPASTKAVVIPYSMLQCHRGRTLPSVLDRPWGRIILDEGHVIRNEETKVSTMVNLLKKDIMWILTATPIQNSIDDLLNMAATIGIETTNTDEIIEEFYLRRTQEEEGRNNPEIALPPLTTKVVKIPFSDPAEKMLYDSVIDIYMERLEAMGSNGSKFRNTAIEGLMRLRQVCAHPFVFFKAIMDKIGRKRIEQLKREGVKRCFIDDSSSDDSDSDADLSDLVTSDDEDDYEPPAKRQNTQSQATREPSNYYKPLKRLEKDEDTLEEMVCAEDLVKYLIKRGVAVTTATGMFGSKIDYLITDLLRARAANTLIKALVFCSFIEEMRTIGTTLDENGISYVCFDGSMARNDKDNAIENFQTTEIEVMVLQVKCGSTGLNLQAANRVYIMTPNYNPCIDIQAVGRSHRKGQTKSVECIRLVIENTVDERCLAISNDKLTLITEALKDDNYNSKLGHAMPTASATGELTNADLKSIFRA